MSYTVSLINFVGPLDLLLQLIERQDMDIVEVSLATITADYIDHINELEVGAAELDWFSQVASKLVLIKSRHLVGQSQSEDMEPTEGQLSDLAEQLQKYRLYQQASRELAQRLGNSQFSRPSLAKRETAKLNYKNLTPADLNQTFTRLQAAALIKPEHQHYVAPKISIELKTRQLKQLLVRPRRLDDILPAEAGQLELIGKLLALLELIRQRFVTIEQTDDGVIISRSQT